MNKSQRRARAMLLLNKLEALRAEWEQAQNNPKEAETSTLYPSRRERLKTIEAEIALLRLTQAEDRLIVQLVIGILSFVGGSVFTLLFKAILS